MIIGWATNTTAHRGTEGRLRTRRFPGLGKGGIAATRFNELADYRRLSPDGVRATRPTSI